MMLVEFARLMWALIRGNVVKFSRNARFMFSVTESVLTSTFTSCPYALLNALNCRMAKARIVMSIHLWINASTPYDQLLSLPSYKNDFQFLLSSANLKFSV